MSAGYLSVRDLAAYSGLSIRTLRARLAASSAPLPHYRLGGKVLVKQTEFDSWMRQFKVNEYSDVDANSVTSTTFEPLVVAPAEQLSFPERQSNEMDRLVAAAVRGIRGRRQL